MLGMCSDTGTNAGVGCSAAAFGLFKVPQWVTPSVWGPGACSRRGSVGVGFLELIGAGSFGLTLLFWGPWGSPQAQSG